MGPFLKLPPGQMPLLLRAFIQAPNDSETHAWPRLAPTLHLVPVTRHCRSARRPPGRGYSRSLNKPSPRQSSAVWDPASCHRTHGASASADCCPHFTLFFLTSFCGQRVYLTVYGEKAGVSYFPKSSTDALRKGYNEDVFISCQTCHAFLL